MSVRVVPCYCETQSLNQGKRHRPQLPERNFHSRILKSERVEAKLRSRKMYSKNFNIIITATSNQ
jgi:hypothetical protein